MATNFEVAIRTAAILLKDGVKGDGKLKVDICRIDTGSYIYKAYMLIFNGRNTEYVVIKENKVSINNRYQQVISQTKVKLTDDHMNIIYDNQGGKLKIPDRVATRILQFDMRLYCYINNKPCIRL